MLTSNSACAAVHSSWRAAAAIAAKFIAIRDSSQQKDDNCAAWLTEYTALAPVSSISLYAPADNTRLEMSGKMSPNIFPVVQLPMQQLQGLSHLLLEDVQITAPPPLLQDMGTLLQPWLQLLLVLQ